MIKTIYVARIAIDGSVFFHVGQETTHVGNIMNNLQRETYAKGGTAAQVEIVGWRNKKYGSMDNFVLDNGLSSGNNFGRRITAEQAEYIIEKYRMWTR